MRRALTALGAVAVLMLGACAPETQTPAPQPSIDSSTPVEATPSEVETPSESPAPAPTPSDSPDPQPEPTPEETPSEESTPTEASSSAPASAWVAVDQSISDETDIDGAGLGEAASHYLRSRLAEPCDVSMNIFAAHPDGFLVGDETGICAGAGLFVYGPSGGQVTELVEFTTVQPCSEFSAAGVPTGVPTTDLFPDGLVCDDGGRRSY